MQLVQPPDAKVALSQALPKPSLLQGESLRPSFKWAILHNWLYYFSLGLSSVNLPRIIATVVNADGSSSVTPRAIRVSGDVEAIDKVLTFMFVGFLGALSDVRGRKPLMAWSAFGYGTTLLLQVKFGCGPHLHVSVMRE